MHHKRKINAKHYLKERNSPTDSGNKPNEKGSDHQIPMIGTIFSLILQDQVNYAV